MEKEEKKSVEETSKETKVQTKIKRDSDEESELVDKVTSDEPQSMSGKAQNISVNIKSDPDSVPVLDEMQSMSGATFPSVVRNINNLETPFSRLTQDDNKTYLPSPNQENEPKYSLNSAAMGVLPEQIDPTRLGRNLNRQQLREMNSEGFSDSFEMDSTKRYEAKTPERIDTNQLGKREFETEKKKYDPALPKH